MTSEREFLSGYDPQAFERPSLTVDLVIFSVFEQLLHVLLVKRADYPAKSVWALPGGFVDIHQDQTLEACAHRKLIEKTGIAAPYLEQVKTYGSARRDPRWWTATVAYFALMNADTVKLSGNQEAVCWQPIDGDRVSVKLAFDHGEILADATERLRSKLEYTHIAVHLLPATFTLPELQKVYEVILQQGLDKSSFRKRVSESGMLEPAPGKKQEPAGRPAQLYRFKNYQRQNFFPRSMSRYAR